MGKYITTYKTYINGSGNRGQNSKEDIINHLLQNCFPISTPPGDLVRDKMLSWGKGLLTHNYTLFVLHPNLWPKDGADKEEKINIVAFSWSDVIETERGTWWIKESQVTGQPKERSWQWDTPTSTNILGNNIQAEIYKSAFCWMASQRSGELL